MGFLGKITYDDLCDGGVRVRMDWDEFYRIRAVCEKTGSAEGDCFIKNYHNFKKLSKNNPYLNYVVMILKYKQSGNIITHAVCYDGDTQIDVAQGYDLQLDRSSFEDGLGSEYPDDLIPTYDILAYRIYNKSNIPSLETILSLYLRDDGDGYRLLTKGKLPRLNGRWEHAKSLVI